MNVIVVGSINMDVVNEVARHPVAGETIHGFGTAYHPGGKGANQGVAAAKSGGKVTFIGAVGDDMFGPQLAEALAAAGIQTDHLLVKSGTSGLAFITVAGDGENTIILSAGANGALQPDNVAALEHVFAGADVLLVQNEIPWETTCTAIELAHQHGVRVFLNPAPAREVDAQVLQCVDVLVVNESETEVITGAHVDTIEDAKAAATILLERGVRQVIVTLGTNGAVFASANLTVHVPAFPVKAVDTTAAGDTFIGALSTRSFSDAKEAIRFASAASAISVTRVGAQPSIPTLAEIEEFLSQRLER